MKIIAIVFLSLLSLVSHSEESCSVSVSKDSKRVYWESTHASGKFLFVKNLDTQLIYPQMLLTQTKGSLSIKLLEPNVKGYQLVLAKINQDTLTVVNNHVAECSAKHDCSMKQSQIKVLKNEPCRIMTSDTLK